jgi:glyoxylase-like metal-dependent hydrolase (beta-lactamase superfamily II)
MHRRTFISNSAALFCAFPLRNFNPFNLFNTTHYMDNDVVKLNIGTCKCTLFRDTQFKYLAKDFFINAGGEELNSALNKYSIQDGNIPSPFIAMLLEQEGRKILVDTGIGFTEKPVVVRDKSYMFKGSLLQLLQQEGVKKEDITDVIITHFHPDHIGGVFSEDEQLNFPNAKFHAHQDEWDFWHTSSSVNQPEQFKYFVQKNITKLKDKDLQLIKGDFVELLPGITAVKADGHTPGQIALIIASGSEKLLFISDAFLHPLHIEQLDWQTNYDLDHDKAKQSRIKLIDLAYKNNMLVNAFHFDFPGLGRVEKYANRWKWNYSEK